MGSFDVSSLIQKALARRGDIVARSDLDCYRLFHDQADGIPGLVIERFGPVLITQVHEERLRLSAGEVRTAAEFFHDQLGTRAVYRKVFVKDRSRPSEAIEQEHHRAEPWIGTAVEPEIQVMENGLRYLVHPYEGFSTGLFLEHRDNRARVRQLAAGKTVLNTFSYACAFSVAAAVGGAKQVDSVDVFKRYLEWGKQNLTANGIEVAGGTTGPQTQTTAGTVMPHKENTGETPVSLPNHLFFCSDVMEFFKRAQRQGRTYDLVILDPPTFARLRRPHRSFVLDEQLEVLCEEAVRVLNPRGAILLATNHRTIPRARLESALQSAVTSRRCRTDSLSLPPDFAGDPDYSKSILARFDA